MNVFFSREPRSNCVPTLKWIGSEPSRLVPLQDGLCRHAVEHQPPDLRSVATGDARDLIAVEWCRRSPELGSLS